MGTLFGEFAPLGQTNYILADDQWFAELPHTDTRASTVWLRFDELPFLTTPEKMRQFVEWLQLEEYLAPREPNETPTFQGSTKNLNNVYRKRFYTYVQEVGQQ